MDYLSLLKSEGCSLLVIRKSKIAIKKEGRGVKPLFDIYSESQNKYEKCILVDKVIGKGAAFLAIATGFSQVYTRLISKQALDMLERKGIKVFYNKLVNNISNRKKTDICPVEKLLSEVEELEKAIELIEKFIDSITV